jgi:hypothetical protein
MAANTGRTVPHWFNMVIDDSGGTIRDIPVNTISVVGIVYSEESGIVAFQDAINGALPNMPDAPISFGGPFDTTAAQAASGTGVAPAFSGSHTVLSAINGLSTPLTVDLQFGIRHTWETGEPQFGITSSAANGYILMSYTVDPSTMLYSAELRLFPGSAAPAWGTAAET